MNDYRDRHLLELAIRPEVWAAFSELNRATFDNSLGPQLSLEVFTVASQGAGCKHCQAHGAYGLSLSGVETQRIRDLWSFETSDAFSAAERAALQFALAAAKAPNEVTPDHHRELREHFSDAQIADILAVVCVAPCPPGHHVAKGKGSLAAGIVWTDENNGSFRGHDTDPSHF
jgi:alkylhydroperoxidase family enzyme